MHLIFGADVWVIIIGVYQMIVNFYFLRFYNLVNHVNHCILGIHVRILNELGQLLDVTCLNKLLYCIVAQK